MIRRFVEKRKKMTLLIVVVCWMFYCFSFSCFLTFPSSNPSDEKRRNSRTVGEGRVWKNGPEECSPLFG